MRVIVGCIILFFYANLLFGQFVADEYYEFGKNKFDEGKFFEAIDFLDKAIKRNPNYVDAIFLRGQSFLALKRYKLAIEDFNQIIDRRKTYDPNSAVHFLNRAITWLEMEEFDLAERDFFMALKLRPDYPDIYYEFARFKFITYYDKNEAIKEINKAIKINPDEPAYYCRRAEYKASMAKFHPDSKKIYESALNDASIAIEMDSNNFNFYQVRTMVNKEKGDPLEAVNDYNKMIEINPYEYESYTERGIIKMQNDLYQSAIRDFTMSINLNLKNEQNYRYRALCRHNILDFSGAYEDYSQSIDLLRDQLKYLNGEEYDNLKRILADTYLKRGAAATSMGNSFNACSDFRMAYDLGSNLGLNYLRKYCGI